MQIHIYIYTQHHNDTRIKTQEDFFKQIYIPLTLFVRVRKGCVGFYCERELETKQKLQYFDPIVMAVSVVSFLFSWCSTGGLGVHPAGCWLSLLHLISNFSGPQTPSGFPRAPSAGRSFLYYISYIIRPSPTGTGTVTWLLSWLSYIIFQRPLDHPLDLWNGMIDRHPAEITVMSFRSHTLPVRQSMRVSWEFFFYLVPFRQPISAHAISSHNCH